MKVLSFLGVIIISILLSSPAITQWMDLYPASYDFGDVEVGQSSAPLEIWVFNNDIIDLTITEIFFVMGNYSQFKITYMPSLPTTLWEFDMALVEVQFEPSSVGLAEDTLMFICNDMGFGDTDIYLRGNGFYIEKPPEEQIEEIIDFFDDSAEEGTLEGDGPGNSAENRLNAFRNMLIESQRLIDEGDYDGAYEQLNSAYKHCDGRDKPVDFVIGEARDDLAEMIFELMEDLGCEESLTKRSTTDFDKDIAALPTEFYIEQNYPNPFNTETMINYSLPEAGCAKILIYNTLGQVVVVLVDKYKSSGYYSVVWDATNQPSGLYFYKLVLNGFTASKKMFLLK